MLFIAEPSDYMDTVSYLFEQMGELVLLAGNAEAAMERALEFGADGIVTFSEHLLPITAAFAERLGLPFHSRDVVEGLRKKDVQRERLRRGGVDEVRTRTIVRLSDWDQAVREIGLPLVLKPTLGAGSRDTHLVTDIESGALICKEFLSRTQTSNPELLIAEEYLAGRSMSPWGDYVSVESVITRGRVLHLGVTGKLPLLPPFRESGQFFPSTLDPLDLQSVTDLAERAVEALGVTEGVTHTEIKLTNQGPRIIEVNGRMGGYMHELYGRGLEANVLEIVTRLACGQEVDVPASRPGAVHFQYLHQPPHGATRFVDVMGGRDVSRHPQVTSYRRLAELGTDLPSDPRTFDLDLLCGRAGSHSEMLRVLDECQEYLTFTFDSPEGIFVMGGREVGER
ncbi:acetyl-CoA carboxylase biotin carboxylase subunit family protein [Streptomyces yangpuensis]|uniref:ATP-grasp domain-containing protein n=1 Tax=Streptomyces yangpuensis TaxID=1648182 RepID=UPI0037F6B9D0